MPKTKGPHSGGPKNTNDEKNLFRKIQTEYCHIIHIPIFDYFF